MRPAVIVRPVLPETTHALRQQVLRPHQGVEEMDWPHDRDPGAVHVGAYAGDELVGVATLVPAAVPADIGDPSALRLRGMAVRPDRQGGGVGAALVGALLEAAVGGGAGTVWCEARTSAEGFYRRLGFVRHGADFDKPGVGPHVVMSLRVGQRLTSGSR